MISAARESACCLVDAACPPRQSGSLEASRAGAGLCPRVMAPAVRSLGRNTARRCLRHPLQRLWLPSCRCLVNARPGVCQLETSCGYDGFQCHNGVNSANSTRPRRHLCGLVMGRRKHPTESSVKSFEGGAEWACAWCAWRLTWRAKGSTVGTRQGGGGGEAVGGGGGVCVVCTLVSSLQCCLVGADDRAVISKCAPTLCHPGLWGVEVRFGCAGGRQRSSGMPPPHPALRCDLGRF